MNITGYKDDFVCGRKRGQAMVEFVIALVAIIVLFGGLMQVSVLSNRHDKVMNEARLQAGINAMTDALGGQAPVYITDWTKGADDVNYSVDDKDITGLSGQFSYKAASYAHSADLAAIAGQNLISGLAGNPDEVLGNLTDGHDSDSVAIIPVIRDFVYNSDTITLDCRVWMVDLGNLYQR